MTTITTPTYTQLLEADGVVIIPGLLGADALRAMQRAFEARLARPRWNDVDGFEMTEPYRHMVQDVLTLDQGFVDLALHPDVKATLARYIGGGYALVEAKGWRSLPTRKDFHGWHGDAWYDRGRVRGIPREVKLAFYLTDVRSGALQYIKGTHGRQAPRPLRPEEVRGADPADVVVCDGPAGTAVLFDTSGVHRQSVPILERRHAVFLTYHDPRIPLQQEDVDYYRYHPLTLNAAFLGGLDADDCRVLGFGNTTNYLPAFQRRPVHPRFQSLVHAAHVAILRADRLAGRVRAGLARGLGRSRPAPRAVSLERSPS